MKVQFAARVIGHELVEGDKPKTDVDRIKVKLAVRPVGQVPGNSGTMSFSVPTEGALQDFPLRRILLITCEEGQKELFEAVDEAEDARPRRDGGPPCRVTREGFRPTSASRCVRLRGRRLST